MVSSYYQETFESPEVLYALIKEEMKSYFDTGAIDDVLFGPWTEKCLKKLGKGSLSIRQEVLHIENSAATLPAGFSSVREVWGATCVSETLPLPTAVYQSVSRNISTDYDRCENNCDPCLPERVNVTYKTTTDVTYSYQITGLLSPATAHARSQCGTGCLNLGSFAPDQFDIRGNKIITSFSTGDVYLVYYATQYDEQGYQMIPAAIRIQDYIEAFLKFKLFEMLCNQAADESYQVIERKRLEAKQTLDEAYVTALNDLKKETLQRKIQKMKRLQDTFKYYHIQ